MKAQCTTTISFSGGMIVRNRLIKRYLSAAVYRSVSLRGLQLVAGSFKGQRGFFQASCSLFTGWFIFSEPRRPQQPLSPAAWRLSGLQPNFLHSERNLSSERSSLMFLWSSWKRLETNQIQQTNIPTNKQTKNRQDLLNAGLLCLLRLGSKVTTSAADPSKSGHKSSCRQ